MTCLTTSAAEHAGLELPLMRVDVARVALLGDAVIEAKRRRPIAGVEVGKPLLERDPRQSLNARTWPLSIDLDDVRVKVAFFAGDDRVGVAEREAQLAVLLD